MKKVNFDFNTEMKTIHVSGGTEENPLTWDDIKKPWIEHGLPVNEDGKLVVEKDYTLNLTGHIYLLSN